MTTAIDEKAPLTRDMTQDEREAIMLAAAEAFERGDDEESDRLIYQLPVLPVLAMHMFETYGKDFCEKSFNLADANKEFGEGWMDA